MCHRALLSVANIARNAGIDPNQAVEDLAAHIHGTRRVSNREIQAAVQKAFSTTALPQAHTPRCRVNTSQLLDAILKRGAGFTEEALWDASPVRPDWPAECDAPEILRRLYAPEERLFIGALHDAGPERVLPVSKWIARFEHCGLVPEHIAPIPLTGQQGLRKDGKLSWRADACVASFRFATVEFARCRSSSKFAFGLGCHCLSPR